MKTGIKVALGFIAGASIGAACTALYFRKEFEKINAEFTEQVNTEIEKIKQDYKEAIDKLTEETMKEPEIKDTKVEKPVKSEVKKKSKEEKAEEATDYTQYSADKKKGKKTVKDVKAEAIKNIIADKTDDETGSEIISMDEYTDDNGYEKITTTYYPADNVFTNDYDDPDPDMVNFVGRLTEKFDEYGEGKSLYVRNNQAQVDIEVIFEDGHYGID